LRRVAAVFVVLLPLAAIAVAAVLLTTSKPELESSATALAEIKLPLGGGSVQRVEAVVGPHAQNVPVRLQGDEVWPVGKLGVGEKVTVLATIARPGWNSWLTGKTEQVRLTVTTPSAALKSTFLSRRGQQPLALHFTAPVRTIAYGPLGSRLAMHTLAAPASSVSLSERATAGTIAVAGAVRTWERPKPEAVSWFPAGAKASAVATPAPGTTIKPGTRITLTFSKPVDKVLGSARPPVYPTTPGTWHDEGSHTITFIPTGYGYGLGAHVRVTLPSGVLLVGGQAGGSDPVGAWSVPAGSTLRLQQLLANLGYLPVNFKQTGSVGATIGAQEAAAMNPPKGAFGWRYANTPAPLQAHWAAGTYGELTKGAVMAFENDQGLAADGIAGPAVWKALIAATLSNRASNFGYTYVYVTEGSPEQINVWHDGKSVVTGPVNTGIAQAPTVLGTYAVYEHIPVGTMSGTNPDGSTYHDPGIPWISYFNGGDALHGFTRASYGFPQSLGCVEMPASEAGAVYPYTPIGTIVEVAA
jgi:peptidoglycan hydrolase-like protein with peptidoglycan-binding domain